MAITTIGSQTREPIEETEYRLLARPKDGIAVLHNTITDTLEEWIANDDHAGYTIQIDRWGYEFARSLA